MEDAKKRFLFEIAKIITRNICVQAVPLSIPESVMNEYYFSKSDIEKWNAQYGIDFSPLTDIPLKDTPSFFVNPQKAKPWLCNQAPITLLETDFAHCNPVTRNFLK